MLLCKLFPLRPVALLEQEHSQDYCTLKRAEKAYKVFSVLLDYYYRIPFAGLIAIPER